jgi:lysophospholipase L1-like esterase
MKNFFVIVAAISAIAAASPTHKPKKASTKATPTLTVRNAAVAGSVPVGMPSHLSIGLFEDTGNTWMKTSGTRWDFRYRYLAYPWSTNYGNGPRDGAFAGEFFAETGAQGFVPAISYYELYDLPPANTATFAKLQIASSMLTYFQDFKLLMQQAKTFGKPVLVMLEPDTTGYLQGDAQSISAYAAIAATGMPELQGLPNTVAGWGLAFLQMRNQVGASNVILGLHVSGWSTGVDLFHFNYTDPLQPAVDSTYAFLAPMGLTANVTGSTYDVLVADPLDRDYDYYRIFMLEDRYWDPSDTAYINSKSFNRYAEWLRLWNLKAGKRWVLWQIPVGNSLSPNTCAQGYKDNRTEYFFGVNGAAHLQKFVDVGVVSLLFGAGADCQTTHETDHGYLLAGATPYLASGGISLLSSQVDSGVPVVDSGVPVVDAGVPVVDAGKPDAGSAVAQYDFENSVQGWFTSGKVISAITPSSVRSASGSWSLSMKLAAVAGTQQVMVNNPPVPSGKTITFKLWFQAGTRLSSVQVFAQEGISTNWRWNGNWKQISALQAGTWNTLTVPLPANSSALQGLGIELTAKKGTAGELVYLDAVGWGGVAPVDAGVVDSGIPVVDAGVPVVDSGVLVVDAGVPVVDAGAPPPLDAGVIAGQIRVMPLGDSITAEEWSWRCALQNDIIASGRQTAFVGNVTDQYDPCSPHHSGNSGWTIGDLQAQLGTWLPTYKPDVVVLMAGSNDVLWWTTETGTQIADRLDAMVTIIRQLLPNVRMVVQTIPPTTSAIIAPNNVDRQVLVQQYNTELRILIGNRVAAGQPVRLADINSVLTLSDLRDGVHPTPTAGITKMTPVIWSALQQLLP